MSEETQLSQPTIKSILRYPGAKWVLAPWIVSLFPPHLIYVEPYFGSGAVFFGKAPSQHEVINDINRDIVNLFAVLRDHSEELAWRMALTPWARDEYYDSYTYVNQTDPLERARRFLVRCWQAHGTRLDSRSGWRHRGAHADRTSLTVTWSRLPERIMATVSRLKRAEIEHQPALEVIRRYADDPTCLIYADPPYLLSTRAKRKIYADEMTDADHLELLDALEKHTGMVVLSGYANALYDTRLAHWQRFTKETRAEKGKLRTEVLWLNPRASTSLTQQRFID